MSEFKKDRHTGYMEMIEFAISSGRISWMQAELVYENDFLEFVFLKPPVHKFEPHKDRGAFCGVFCAAKSTDSDGSIFTNYMSAAQIEDVKRCSKQAALWEKWFSEFAKKAVIKRLWKTIPKNGEDTPMDTAVELENEDEGYITLVSKDDIATIRSRLDAKGKKEDAFLRWMKIEKIEHLNEDQYKQAMSVLS